MSAHTTAADLSSVDLTDLDLWADGTPHDLFARMRAECPAHWNDTADGPGFWSITQGRDITQISADPGTFSPARGGIFLRPNTLIPLEMGRRDFMLWKDPPEHSKYRAVISKFCLPRTLILVDEVIDDIVTTALEEVSGRGECDVVSDIAVPIVATVIARLLGAPDEDIEQLNGWTRDIEHGITHDLDKTRTVEEMGIYCSKLVGNQVIRGVDTLASTLAQPDADGNQLSETEIAGFFAMLLFVGNNHTRNAISSAVLALLRHPDQLERLRAEPTRLRPKKSGLPPVALQELLRWSTPVNYLARTATTDTAVAGQQIKAGERVVMWYASASRDSEAITDAGRLNLTRTASDPPHYAFGGGGEYYCQGAALTYRILSVTLREILRRMPGLALAGPVSYEPSAFVTALTSLPVSFDRAEAGDGVSRERELIAQLERLTGKKVSLEG
jgi:cholest-4-en-3-one 26-monooxygenase